MIELDALRRENESLRLRNEELLRRTADAERALAALARTDSAGEEALRRSEARFRALIEKSNDAISLTAADGTTFYRSPSIPRLLGFTSEEMAGRVWTDSIFPEDRARFGVDVDHLIRRRERELVLEFRAWHRDGSVRWMEGSATNQLDDPDVGAIVGNFRDVTARKHAEEALRETRDLLEEAQEIAHVGSWTSGLEPDGEIKWSAECYRVFGVPLGTAMTVDSFFACVFPGDREDVRRASGNAIAHNTPYDIEHRVQWPDGQVRWVRERALAERDTSGLPIRLVGTVQDVTEQHLAIEALLASEERYRRIVENTSEGIWMFDAHGNTKFMNARMATMLGLTVDEAVAQKLDAFMDASSQAALRARLERGQNGISERNELRLRRKDGTDLWASVQSNPLFDADGRFEMVLALVTNVSAQRLADDARARLAAIVDSSEDAILSTSPNGAITSWNRGAEKLYHYSANEVMGKHIALLAPPAAAAAVRLLENVGRGESVHQLDTQTRRKDGSLVEVALTVSPLRNRNGTVIGASGIVRDLTARRETEATLRRTEEQFRQAQKMEAVGRLAGGVAHDFNNLLSVILSYASLAIRALKPGDPLRDDIGEIQSAGQRAAELTRQLLAFSRQQILQPKVIDLNDIITGMKSMLGRLLGEDVVLTTLTTANIGRVLADRGQIEQVVMNLAVNARDAMPDGGKLTIETANVHFDASQVSGSLSVAPGDYVVLAISDTGIGMNATVRARIFEPFFTTKEQGKGTGLGLATVFGIVRQSGGNVSVYSEPGGGTTFRVYLPRSDRSPDQPTVSRPPAALRGSETILLVEDEQQVRAVACAILRRNGYQVLETSNGGDAILISRDFPTKIDLLLTDVVMPGMNGRKLAEQLGLQRPEMKLLFASGYTDDAIVRHGVLDAGVAFLQKPFTPDVLLLRVREVLDALESCSSDDRTR